MNTIDFCDESGVPKTECTGCMAALEDALRGVVPGRRAADGRRRDVTTDQLLAMIRAGRN